MTIEEIEAALKWINMQNGEGHPDHVPELVAPEILIESQDWLFPDGAVRVLLARIKELEGINKDLQHITDMANAALQRWIDEDFRRSGQQVVP